MTKYFSYQGGKTNTGAAGKCPAAGEGVHNYLFTEALKFHRMGVPVEAIYHKLAAAVANCGRVVGEREIADAVHNSAKLACTRRKAEAVRPTAKAAGVWPEVDPVFRARIITDVPMRMADLHDCSPVQIEGAQPDAEWFVDWLFKPDHLLCVGENNSSFVTAPREDLRGSLSSKALIVPSPMISIYGTTQKGKRSMHTLDNTGPRYYLVTEFDRGAHDEQAALIWHLGGYAPLAMVVYSGGKSLHAWFSCRRATDDQQRKFFRYACSLGADPATESRCQFVRMPQGWRREKGVRQDTLYFNPENTWNGDAHG